MILELSDEALEYGRTAQRALDAAGGDALAPQAHRDPANRAGLVEPVLGELGAWDLSPRDSVEELEAAAALCRAAGWFALAYPVAERLCRPHDADVDGLVAVDLARPAAALADLGGRWMAVGLDGRRFAVSVGAPAGPPEKYAFIAALDLEPVGPGRDEDLALALTLPCWTVLGLLDRAMTLTIDHVRQREQFGQPLAAFQGVQFQLTDAQVERAGLEELAKYTLWSVQTRRPEMVDDALALRLAALHAADVVLRICHQLHGAIGFCDETMISWVSRVSRSIRRLPLGLSATRDALARRVDRRGLTGIYGGALG